MKWWSSIIVIAFSSISQAQWSSNPGSNSWIPKAGDEQVPLADTDGKGGIIVAWDENRGYGGIWANRVDKYGSYRWGLNGVRVSPPNGLRDVTNVLNDGSGGAIIVWDDYTKARWENPNADFWENEIYVQRVDSSGKVLWDSSGVVLRSKIARSRCGGFQIVTSDHNTFIVLWFEDRPPRPQNSFTFYAQRIDLKGKIYWSENGEHLTPGQTIYNVNNRVIPDGENGFLLVRFNPGGQQDVIVDRFSAQGTPIWSLGQVHANTGGAFEATSDGQGGVIVVGAYFPGGGFISEGRIQRIDRNGRLCWSDSAIVFVQGRTQYLGFEIVPNTNSGALVTWSDCPGIDTERRFLAFDSSGAILWRKDGFRFCIHTTSGPIIVPNDLGTMILIINDYEINGANNQGHQVAFAMDKNGDAVWGQEGVLFRHRAFNDWPFSIIGVSDGKGGVIAVWSEGRQNTSYDVTMQLINARGELGNVLTSVEEAGFARHEEDFVVYQNYPNPFNPETEIVFQLRKPQRVSLKVYDLSGREVVTLLKDKLCANKEVVKWNGKDSLGQKVGSGIYFYEIVSDRLRIVRKMLLFH